MITRKQFVWSCAGLLCVIFMLVSNMAGAAESAAITVNASLGSIGTATELILCPMVGKTIRDSNWMYQTLPDGSANTSYPPVVQNPTSPLAPSAPVVSDLSQTWASWNVAQTVVVDSTDQQVPMEQVLFDSVASTTVASGDVVIYVDSDVACFHQDAYRAYLKSKGIAYNQIERDSIPNYPALVGGMNYLSPGGVTIPFLLIGGEPVVGKFRDRTKGRIDMLLKKHGLVP